MALQSLRATLTRSQGLEATQQPPNPQPQAFLHPSDLTFYRGCSQRVKRADVIAWLYKMWISVKYQFTLQHRVDSSENRCSTGVSCPHIASHTDFPCPLWRFPFRKDCQGHTGRLAQARPKYSNDIRCQVNSRRVLHHEKRKSGDLEVYLIWGRKSISRTKIHIQCQKRKIFNLGLWCALVK